VSTELPKMGVLLWVEIAPSTPHYRLTVEDDGQVIVTDTLATVDDGHGGREPLVEEISFESIARDIGEILTEYDAGNLWKVIAVHPGLMPE
jgi:hypothetical protein